MSFPRAPVNPAAATLLLEHEFAQEKASALGRLGRRLEAALAELANFEAAHPNQRLHSPAQRAAREALMATASMALWQFIVQREACGLRDLRQVLRDYRVPQQIAVGMGAMPKTILRKLDSN